MTLLASYLLKVILCSGILFVYYHAALRNKLFHQWNRFYLLAAVVLSIVAPIVQIEISQAHELRGKILYAFTAANSYLDAVVISGNERSAEEWVAIGYAAVSILFFIAFLMSVIKLYQIINSHVVKDLGSIKFVNTTVAGSPFSFFRYIFWNTEIKLDSETGQQIFQHELVHVKEKHSADKLFIQIILMVFWCNPFFWLIRREMKAIHEFIADKKSAGENGVATLAKMILHAGYTGSYHSFTNQFFQTSIKRRLSMLTKIQNPKLNYISRVLALPVIAAVVMAFTLKQSQTHQSAMQLNEPVARSVSDTVPTVTYKGKTVKRAEVSLSGNKAYITFTDGSKDSLTIQEAYRLNIAPPPPPGVRINYDSAGKPLIIVDGKKFDKDVNTIDPNSIDRVDVLKGSSATSKYGDDGKNGVVEIKTKDGTFQSNVIKVHTANKPLVIVDGKKFGEDVNSIDRNSIERINVLKGSSATSKYGDEGKNGVIEVKTKNGIIVRNVIVENVSDTIPVKEVVVQGKPLNKGMSNTSGEKVVVKDITVTGKPIFEKAETPASVDKAEWRRFLEQNLQSVIEQAAKNGMKSGSYTVQMRFIVETDGSLSDIHALNNPGYDLAQTAEKMLVNSPKWNPAVQNGRKVRSYHTQPITFVISEK